MLCAASSSAWCCRLLGNLITSQMTAFFMVTAATSSGPAEPWDSSGGNAAGMLPGTRRDRFLPVRHSSYIWTLGTLDTENAANWPTAYIWTLCTPDTESGVNWPTSYIWTLCTLDTESAASCTTCYIWALCTPDTFSGANWPSSYIRTPCTLDTRSN
jgi:hypothetical protein